MRGVVGKTHPAAVNAASKNGVSGALAIWRTLPLLTWDEADARLHGDAPAWELTLRGEVAAVNVPALWLWHPQAQRRPSAGQGRGARAPLPDRSAVLGSSVFDVVAHNLWRLPTAANSDFLAGLVRLRRQLGATPGGDDFRTAMLVDPARRRLYEQAEASEPGTPEGGALEGTLRLAFPDDPDDAGGVRLLELRASASAVSYKGEPHRYLVSYTPQGDAEGVLTAGVAALMAAGQPHPAVYYANPVHLADGVSSEVAASWAALGSEPQVTLYADDSAAGREAAAVLTAAEVTFRTVAPDTPWAVVADFGGLRFEGVDGVRRLAKTLRRMGDVFVAEVRKAYPHLFRS